MIRAEAEVDRGDPKNEDPERQVEKQAVPLLLSGVLGLVASLLDVTHVVTPCYRSSVQVAWNLAWCGIGQ